MEGQKLLVICSFSNRRQKLRIPGGFDLQKGKLILANYKKQEGELKPWECRVYLWEE